jgi:CsoR family transcriptional regulator, copper-sensing transcriptional repressor
MVTATQRTHQHLYGKDKETLLKRMRRIEGQARGVQRMIEEDRYCPEVIQQLTAVSRAVGEVSLLLLQDHIEGCVTDAIQHDHGEEMIRELVGVIRRTMRT